MLHAGGMSLHNQWKTLRYEKISLHPVMSYPVAVLLNDIVWRQQEESIRGRCHRVDGEENPFPRLDEAWRRREFGNNLPESRFEISGEIK